MNRERVRNELEEMAKKLSRLMRHCAMRDPVAVAVIRYSIEAYGPDDEHTRTAREQLARARARTDRP